VTGPKTTTWKTTYKKCEALKTKCNTAAQAEGTIITEQLSSTLVNLDKGPGHKRPGILVKGGGPGGRLAQYECLNKGLNVEVFGAVLAEVTGNLNTAAKSTVIKVKEGPLKMQSDMYQEEVSNEEGGKAYFEWGFAMEACQKGEPPFPPGPHSAAECIGFIGGPPAPAPTSLISVVSGAQNAKAPAVQNGETAQKGESMLIEDN